MYFAVKTFGNEMLTGRYLLLYMKNAIDLVTTCIFLVIASVLILFTNQFLSFKLKQLRLKERH